MANTVIQKNTNASTDKPITSKPLPRDKAFGLDPSIRFYKVEDGDMSEE